jgi:hypothetical protein
VDAVDRLELDDHLLVDHEVRHEHPDVEPR